MRYTHCSCTAFVHTPDFTTPCNKCRRCTPYMACHGAAMPRANDVGVVTSSAGSCHFANNVKDVWAEPMLCSPCQHIQQHDGASAHYPGQRGFPSRQKASPAGPGCLCEGTGRAALVYLGQQPANRARTWPLGCRRSRPCQTRPACPRPSSPGCAAKHAASAPVLLVELRLLCGVE